MTPFRIRKRLKHLVKKSLGLESEFHDGDRPSYSPPPARSDRGSESPVQRSQPVSSQASPQVSSSKPPVPSPAAKPPENSAPTSKAAATQAAKKPATKKAAAKKPEAKKAAAKKPATKKTSAKKPAAKKAAAKKSVTKKATAKKPATKKAAAKKPAAKKASAKKTVAKKTAAKKTAGKKTAAKKTAGKKTAAKKAGGKKATASKGEDGDKGSSEPGGELWVQAPGVVASEVVPDTAHTVEVFGTRYALYKVGDDFFATQDSCPHAGGPLGGGDLDGHKVSCPFHGYEFDVRDGQCSSGQPFEIACVPVRVKSERVLLRVGS